MFILPGLYAPSVMSGSVGLHMNLPSLLAPCTFVFDEKWSHIVKPKTKGFFFKSNLYSYNFEQLPQEAKRGGKNTLNL